MDGNPSLLKEVREKKIKSREEKEELVETEDVVHLGNISDKVRTYMWTLRKRPRRVTIIFKRTTNVERPAAAYSERDV